MEADERRAVGGLRKAVGHPDHHGLLQAEDVIEVIREVSEHRQLGRARVAEDRRHSPGPEELERGVAHGGHQPPPY
jgi:hypothetical protein